MGVGGGMNSAVGQACRHMQLWPCYRFTRIHLLNESIDLVVITLAAAPDFL